MQLVAQQCCVASWDCLLHVLLHSRATNVRVAKSESGVCFLQHENLLRENVVIRATNNHNLQRQHCCGTSCTKMLPVLLGLKSGEVSHENWQEEASERTRRWHKRKAKQANKLRIKILRDVALVHPICYENHNLCKLIANSKLSKFAIQMLRDICEHFDIPTADVTTKKAPYIERTVAFGKKCTCQGWSFLYMWWNFTV